MIQEKKKSLLILLLDKFVFCAVFTNLILQQRRNEGRIMKKWMKQTAAICLAAVMAAGGIAGCAKKQDPKEAVIEAFKGLTKDDTVKPFEEMTGMSKIVETSRTSGSEGSFSLRLDSCVDPTVNQFAGLGIKVLDKTDVKNKKTMFSMEGQYGGNTLLTANFFLDDTFIKANIPELSKKVFSLNYADDLTGQIENGTGMLAQFIKYEGLEGMDMDALKEYIEYVQSIYNEENRPFDVEALWNRYKEGSKAIDNLKAAMVVTQGEAVSFTIDGKEQKCDGYQVVLSKDAIVEFIQSTSDFFLQDETLKNDMIQYMQQIVNMSSSYMIGRGMSGEEMQQQAWEQAEEAVKKLAESLQKSMGDITMNVYVDKKGALAAVNGSSTITDDDSDETVTVSFDMKLEGGAYKTQNMTAEFGLTDDSDSNNFITLAMDKKGTYDKKKLTSNLGFVLDIAADGSTDTYSLDYEGSYDGESGDYTMLLDASAEDLGSFALSVSGLIDNLENGKSFDAYMDAIDLQVNGQKILGMSGTYSIHPLEGEIESLEGEEMDILAASESDWMNVGMEMYTSGMSIMGSLAGSLGLY